jgi:hypothetical protein
MSSLRDVSTGSLSVPATYRYTSTHIFISDTFLDEAANIISDTFLDEATGLNKKASLEYYMVNKVALV